MISKTQKIIQVPRGLILICVGVMLVAPMVSLLRAQDLILILKY